LPAGNLSTIITFAAANRLDSLASSFSLSAPGRESSNLKIIKPLAVRSTSGFCDCGGADGTRTRDLQRDRLAF
jgi:hypothetical protein